MKAPIIALALVVLAGCTDQDTAAPAGSPGEAAGEAREPGVFDPLTGTLDRAAGVEATLEDSAAARRRQLEEAEGR